MAVSSKTINLTERSAVPAIRFEAVDISSTDYTPTGGSFREVFIGGSVTSTLVVKDAGLTTLTFTGLIAGVFHRIGGVQITKTGTSPSTGIIAAID